MREDRFGQAGIQQFENEITELADYLNEHVKEVGKDQAIIDLQVGLNLLNDYRKESLIESKVQLKEDSDLPSFSKISDFVKNGLTEKRKIS